MTHRSESTATKQAARDLAKSGLAFRIMRALLQQEPGRNALLSPASVIIVLHILHEAASGETREELANALEIGGWSPQEIQDTIRVQMCVQHEPGQDVELAIATALWLDRSMQCNKEFAATISRAYSAEIHTADFSSRTLVPTVNDWVRVATKQKILEILTAAPPLLRFMALNAVYFKGIWEVPFDKDATQRRQFTLADGSRIVAPLMSKSGRFHYHEGQDFQAVRLWYSGYRYGMDVVLPQGKPQEFLRTLGAQEWKELTAGYAPRRGYLEMPRFKFGNSWELGIVLGQLGLTRLFDPQRADFSAMAQGPLWVDSILHKTFIETVEKGTEAAAVTSVRFLGASEGWYKEPPPFRMIVDRPFVFAIREHPTGALLFLGVLENPGESLHP